MSAPDTIPDEPRASEGSPGVARFFAPARLIDLGSAAQASIPGVYAWAVTVAPAAWGKGGSWLAKLLALAGIGALAAALALERRYPRAARAGSVWGLALASALVWAMTPGALTPVRLEATRGLAGMLGWALFAFASAAPPIERNAGDRILEGSPLRPRTRMPKGDALVMALGALIACTLQVIGWHASGPERAVLVRLVCLATGLAVLGAATTIALARHSRRLVPPRRVRMREGLPWLVLLGILVATGVIGQLFVK